MLTTFLFCAGAPNLNLTPDEKRVYGQLFRQADTESVGVVTGDIAVKFFEKTRLDSRLLGEVWQIADSENRGFLTPAGFGVALRLIGHAQAGREPSPQVALQTGPIPRFDGFTPTAPPLAPAPTGSPQPISAQGTGNAPIRIPPLTPEKVSQYASLFERQSLQNGQLLSGEQARQIFEKSGLPNETLGRIWQLADTEQRGALVLTEFVIAMHLLTSMKSGALRALPNILPAPLYEAATRRAPAGAGPGAARPQSPSGPGLAAIPRQLSGQAQMPMRTGSPLGPAFARQPLAPQSTGDAWLVTPQDKHRFDMIYEGLDKQKKGFITGEEAVPFFSQSNLSEVVLANIWDLADIRQEGRLNRDEFAVAMYLIRQQRMKQGDLPQTLPPALMPPSLRGQARPPTAAGAFDSPPPAQPQAPRPEPPKPASALDDLFGLDSAPTPAPAAGPTAAAGPPALATDPFAGSASPAAPTSPARMSPTPTGGFKPFMPTSSFGRSLTTQGTGDSGSGAAGFPKPAAPPQPSVADDLLGDAEPDTKGSNMNDTMELANLSNQVSTLSKSMQDVQGQRNATQNELNQTSQQKKTFEQRLSQLRTMYENQAKEVRELQDKLNTSRADTRKLQGDCLTLEGTLKDLQGQHQTLFAALQADQQENASLKEKIRAVNAEVAAIKPQIEKLKSETRQQKGLVAINKKQLATNEGERDKLKGEAEDLTKESQELARQLSQSPQPGPPPQVASPAPSNASGNNPFFRRTGSTDMMGAFASPGASSTPKTYNDKSFDDVFGPAFPPFKPQDTGASAASTGSFATPTSNSPNVSRNPTFASEANPVPPEPRQVSSSIMPLGAPA